MMIFVNMIMPLSGAAPAAPQPPASHGWLLVANKGDHTLGIIDPDAGREVATIPDGGITGHEVAASADGKRAYMPIYGNSGVGAPGTDGAKMTVMDLDTHRALATVDFGKGVRPHCAVFGPRNGLLYVTTELNHTITVIDPKTLKIVGSIPTGQPESHMMAITPDGRHAYTANVHVGTVSAIDLIHHKVLKVIPISKETQRIAITPNGKLAVTADQTKPQLAVIDTASNTVKTWVALPAIAYGTAPTRDGRWLLVTLPSIAKVGVVDLNTLKLVRTIDVVASPQEILVRPDDRVAYVSCDHSAKVAAVDLESWKVAKMIDAGKECDGLAWAHR